MSLSNLLNGTKKLSQRFITVEAWLLDDLTPNEFYIYSFIKSVTTMDGYEIRRCVIEKKIPIGKDAFAKAWKGLQEKNLLFSKKSRDKNGKFKTDFFIAYSKDTISKLKSVVKLEKKEENGEALIVPVCDEDGFVNDDFVDENSMEKTEIEPQEEIKEEKLSEEVIAELKQDIEKVQNSSEIVLSKDGNYGVAYDSKLFKDKKRYIVEEAICDNLKVLMSRAGIKPTKWNNFISKQMSLAVIYQVLHTFKKKKGRSFKFFCTLYMDYCALNNIDISKKLYNHMNAYELKQKKKEDMDQDLLNYLVEKRLQRMPCKNYKERMDLLIDNGYEGDLEEVLRGQIEDEVFNEYHAS